MAWDSQDAADAAAADAAAAAAGGGWGGAPGPAGAGYGGGGMPVGSSGYGGASTVGGVGGAYGGGYSGGAGDYGGLSGGSSGYGGTSTASAGPVGGAAVGGPAMGSSAVSAGAAQAAANVGAGDYGGLSTGSSGYGGPSTAGGYGAPATGPAGPVLGGSIASAVGAGGYGGYGAGLGGLGAPSSVGPSSGYGGYGGYQGAGPGSESGYGAGTTYGGAAVGGPAMGLAASPNYANPDTANWNGPFGQPQMGTIDAGLNQLAPNPRPGWSTPATGMGAVANRYGGLTGYGMPSANIQTAPNAPGVTQLQASPSPGRSLLSNIATGNAAVGGPAMAGYNALTAATGGYHPSVMMGQQPDYSSDPDFTEQGVAELANMGVLPSQINYVDEPSFPGVVSKPGMLGGIPNGLLNSSPQPGLSRNPFDVSSSMQSPQPEATASLALQTVAPAPSAGFMSPAGMNTLAALNAQDRAMVESGTALQNMGPTGWARDFATNNQDISQLAGLPAGMALPGPPGSPLNRDAWAAGLDPSQVRTSTGAYAPAAPGWAGGYTREQQRQFSPAQQAAMAATAAAFGRAQMQAKTAMGGPARTPTQAAASLGNLQQEQGQFNPMAKGDWQDRYGNSVPEGTPGSHFTASGIEQARGIRADQMNTAMADPMYGTSPLESQFNYSRAEISRTQPPTAAQIAAAQPTAAHPYGTVPVGTPFDTKAYNFGRSTAWNNPDASLNALTQGYQNRVERPLSPTQSLAARQANARAQLSAYGNPALQGPAPGMPGAGPRSYTAPQVNDPGTNVPAVTGTPSNATISNESNYASRGDYGRTVSPVTSPAPQQSVTGTPNYAPETLPVETTPPDQVPPGSTLKSIIDPNTGQLHQVWSPPQTIQPAPTGTPMQPVQPQGLLSPNPASTLNPMAVAPGTVRPAQPGISDVLAPNFNIQSPIQQPGTVIQGPAIRTQAPVRDPTTGQPVPGTPGQPAPGGLLSPAPDQPINPAPIPTGTPMQPVQPDPWNQSLSPMGPYTGQFQQPIDPSTGMPATSPPGLLGVGVQPGLSSPAVPVGQFPMDLQPGLSAPLNLDPLNTGPAPSFARDPAAAARRGLAPPGTNLPGETQTAEALPADISRPIQPTTPQPTPAIRPDQMVPDETPITPTQRIMETLTQPKPGQKTLTQNQLEQLTQPGLSAPGLPAGLLSHRGGGRWPENLDIAAAAGGGFMGGGGPSERRKSGKPPEGGGNITIDKTLPLRGRKGGGKEDGPSPSTGSGQAGGAPAFQQITGHYIGNGLWESPSGQTFRPNVGGGPDSGGGGGPGGGGGREPFLTLGGSKQGQGKNPFLTLGGDRSQKPLSTSSRRRRRSRLSQIAAMQPAGLLS